MSTSGVGSRKRQAETDRQIARLYASGTVFLCLPSISILCMSLKTCLPIESHILVLLQDPITSRRCTLYDAIFRKESEDPERRTFEKKYWQSNRVPPL